ncbi:hypothetical protein PENTCL1PPCAC_12043, partial [Pristionchus entomophagus]
SGLFSMLALFTLLLLLSTLPISTVHGGNPKNSKINVDMSVPEDESGSRVHQYFNLFRFMEKVLLDPEF